MISKLLGNKLPKHKIWTVTNNYNQVFDCPNQWHPYRLPLFEGVTLLCVTAGYRHKNIGISVDVARRLKHIRPNLKFRFVFTVSPEELVVPKDLEQHFELIGRVPINEVPSLYEDADIMFQPTLIECFSATYAEAMRMGVPVVTTKLDFAKGLCKDAAVYYDPLNAQSATEAILKVVDSKDLRNRLVESGKSVLATFDSSKQRADKLIAICEQLIKKTTRQTNSALVTESPEQ